MKQIIYILIILFSLMFREANSQTIEKQSIVEFGTGKTNKYSTNGLGKSQGLKLHIKYPSSWESLEGEHPHVVRKFIQPDKYTYSMIIIKKMDDPLSLTETDEFFTIAGLKSMIPSGSEVLNTETNLKIEGLRAASIDYSNSAVRMDRLFISYNRQYVFFYKSYLVNIQFMLTDKKGESKESVSKRFKAIQPLFPMMFNSIVIDNRWD